MAIKKTWKELNETAQRNAAKYEGYGKVNVPPTDRVIQGLISNPNNEFAGSVSYVNPKTETINTYTPPQSPTKLGVNDAAVQKILNNPNYEIGGGFSYSKGGNTYTYEPTYAQPTSNAPVANSNNPYADRDISQELLDAYSRGDYDLVAQLEKDLRAKVALNGGAFEGGSVDDYLNNLRRENATGYNRWKQNQTQQQLIQQLLGNNTTSPYDEIYQSLLERYNGYDFDDFTKSSAYQGLKSLYEMSGQKAMKDTLGEIAARTGGYASSYATAAAQQQYQNYMQQLVSLAKSMYKDEKSGMLDDLKYLGNRIDTDISRQQNNNITLYNALKQVQDEYRADERAEESANAQAQKDYQEYAKGQIINALEEGGLAIEQLDEGLLTASGLTYMDLLAYSKIYADKDAQQQFENKLAEWDRQIKQQNADTTEYKAYNPVSSRRGSSGGGSRRGRGTGGNDTGDEADYPQFNYKDYLTENGFEYEKMYEDGATVLELLDAIEQMYNDGLISNRDKETYKRVLVSKYE